MVKLFEEDKREQGRQSSKGNQLKFEREGIWYKADYLGYEGLAEYVVSKLLAHSSLKEDEYVGYDLEQIEYNGNIYNGCKSKDFANGWQLITLERLFKQLNGQGLNKMIYSINDHSSRLKTLVDEVERATGIKDFGIYMSKLLTVDAFILNDDRHTHNIAVLTKNMKDFKIAPIFDNAAGLLSDTMMDYPLHKETVSLIDMAKPKTFCDSFDEQLDIAEQLYGYNVKFTFTYEDVKSIIDNVGIYSDEIKKRVTDVIMQMRRKYDYLF